MQRAQFYELNRLRLIELLQRAKVKSQEADEPFVVVCIDVDDKTWAALVELLMPGFDWQAIRDWGEHPVARGVVPRQPVLWTIDNYYPAALPVPEGEFCAVFAAGGVLAIVPE